MFDAMNYLRTVYRLFGFILITFLAAVIGISLKLFGAKHKRVFKVYNAWKWCILTVMNIKVTEIGERPTSPGILMANHRSYVDVALTPSKIPFVIVAKKSVKSWPLVGLGGSAISTIWVDRQNKDSRHETRDSMKARLEKGGSVLVFPEGTTAKGPEPLELKPGMFFVCADGGFPIHPMAIEYQDQDIAWVGNDLFIPHFIKHFGKRRVNVTVKYGPTLIGNDGDVLRDEMYNWLKENLLEMRKDWDSLKSKVS